MEVTYTNGVRTSSRVIRAAVDRIIAVGTKKPAVTKPDPDPTKPDPDPTTSEPEPTAETETIAPEE